MEKISDLFIHFIYKIQRDGVTLGSAFKIPYLTCIIYTLKCVGLKPPIVKAKDYAEDLEWKFVLLFNGCHMTLMGRAVA
jgi:hypothetical protein